MTRNSGTPDAAPSPGDRVVHAALGPGRVVRLERGGRWLWVAFDRSPLLPFRVRGPELAAESGNADVRKDDLPQPNRALQGAASMESRPRDEARGSDGEAGRGSFAGPEPRDVVRHRALVVLEALRLGTVPHGNLRAYTVGRDANLEAVLSALDPTPGAGGRLRVVVGDYGTGKTHLMESVRDEALERGWAVASATLDSRETTPAHPRRVYSALVRSLSLPAFRDPGGLGALFDVLIERGGEAACTYERGGHRYLGPALHYYARLGDRPELRDLLLEWIEGQPGERSNELNDLLRHSLPGPRLLALPDYRTFALAYAYVLGGVACLCREAGARGLCLLLDEAEFYAALDAENRGFADNLFGCYSLAALGGGEARREEIDLARGGQEVHRRLPLRYRVDQPLACAFFLTPQPQGLEALDRWVELSRHAVELSPLRPAHYAELYERIHRLYETAHPGFSLPGKLARPMGEFLHAALAAGAIANPRAVLKLLVEFLDICRLSPHHLGAVLDDLGRLFA